MIYMTVLVGLKLTIALILLTSLFGRREARLFDLAENEAALSVFLTILDRVHGPFVIALVYLLLDAAPLLALSMLGLMMLTGYVIKRTGNVGSCNCYGSLAVAGTKRETALHALLLTVSVATLALTLLSPSAGRARPSGPGLFLLSLILGAVGTYASNSKHNPTPLVKSQTAVADLGEHERTHHGEMPVGQLKSGDIVHLGQIAATCPMIITYRE